MEITKDKSQIPIFKFQTIFKFKILIISIFISAAGCSRDNYHLKIVEYLKAERDLRKRVSEEYGLADSIKILQKKYHLNLDKELAKIKDNPEAWIRLLKELEIDK